MRKPQDVLRTHFSPAYSTRRFFRDEIVEFCRVHSLRFSRADITRAISLLLMDRAEQRRIEILTPLIEVELSQEELNRADAEFMRLAKLFDMPEELCVACVRHFMWLVKRKQTRRIADHPLMLVIYNAIQGWKLVRGTFDQASLRTGERRHPVLGGRRRAQHRTSKRTGSRISMTPAAQLLGNFSVVEERDHAVVFEEP